VSDPGLHIPNGFQLGTAACRIKKSGGPDLALIVAPHGAAASAVFTTNRLAAAPVVVAKTHLRRSRGKIHAVITNSGNANCATGRTGLDHAVMSCAALAMSLNVKPATIIPASTGVIGVPLPVERLLSGIPHAIANGGDSDHHIADFAAAIMTTDTRPKIAGAANLLGFAKGAGMIHPNMATMLGYVLTDVTATPTQLSRILKPIIARTFNRISIDGDTSTNDMVIVLASGKSPLNLASTATARQFATALESVCASLAEQIVRDAEGLRHFVRLHIQGARSETEAERIAATIATSPLVKTAWAGADPNWGRILAAIGRSGIAVDVSKVDITFGEMPVCRGGVQVPFDEDAAYQYLSQPDIDIHITLNRGKSSLMYLTCDLTTDYVRINADYRT
jgi:glutamate N-acetyltransferase/amino-acid N-acetyltransferase